MLGYAKSRAYLDILTTLLNILFSFIKNYS